MSGLVERKRLPNRRGHEVIEFTHNGFGYTAGIGRFDDGKLAEVFLNADKIGTAIETQARDAAITASLFFQNGGSPGDLAPRLDAQRRRQRVRRARQAARSSDKLQGRCVMTAAVPARAFSPMEQYVAHHDARGGVARGGAAKDQRVQVEVLLLRLGTSVDKLPRSARARSPECSPVLRRLPPSNASRRPIDVWPRLWTSGTLTRGHSIRRSACSTCAPANCDHTARRTT